ENQVTRFGGGNGGINGFQIAHFTNQNDVGILTQSAAQCLGETGHVHVNFTLGDNGLFVFVIKFDGVFDGDDVGLFAFLVDDIDHGGKRSALAGTGGAGHKAKTAWFVKQFTDGRRQANLVQFKKLVWNLSQHHAEVALLFEHADAETRKFAE